MAAIGSILGGERDFRLLARQAMEYGHSGVDADPQEVDGQPTGPRIAPHGDAQPHQCQDIFLLYGYAGTLQMGDERVAP